MVPQDLRALLILFTVVPRPCLSAVSQHEGGPLSCCLPFPSPCLTVPLAPLGGTQCPVFFLPVCHCLQSRGVGMNPGYLPQPPCQNRV